MTEKTGLMEVRKAITSLISLPLFWLPVLPYKLTNLLTLLLLKAIYVGKFRE